MGFRVVHCPVAQLSGQLIGCHPVATEHNYQQYNIKCQYLNELKKCATLVLTVPYAADLHVQKIRKYCQTWTEHSYGK